MPNSGSKISFSLNLVNKNNKPQALRTDMKNTKAKKAKLKNLAVIGK